MSMAEVIKHLKADLRWKRPPKTQVFRMNYRQLPLNCETQFHGIPLRAVIAPRVEGTGAEIEAMFDAWMDGVKHGYDPVEALLERPGAEVLVGFVQQVKTPEEQIVRLLMALGNTDGATLSVGKDHLLVNGQFGISNGVINSRFCKDIPIDVDLWSLINDRPLTRTFDRDFCLLYRVCARIDTPTLEALISIKQASPRFVYKTLMDEVKPPRTPTKITLEKLEQRLFLDKDPILKLYGRLVPLWMTKCEFRKNIERVEARDLNPNEDELQVILNKMLKFFHDRKTESTGCQS